VDYNSCKLKKKLFYEQRDSHLNSQKRINLLKNWASQELKKDFLFLTASSDASFRRYYRLKTTDKSYIVMDAPPKNESIKSFLEIDQILTKIQVNVPDIYAYDKDLGFILMEDFGSTTYLDVLNNDNQENLYTVAINSLIKMQRSASKYLYQTYSKEMLINEMMLFVDWYLKKYKEYDLSKKEHEDISNWFEGIVKKILSQQKVFVHRDFHSRNLMKLASKNPGILDFQDALEGPITYDLVSLLKDAYIEWDEEVILDHSVKFWENAKTNQLIKNYEFSEFYKDFECMGIQRHLKVLGIFSRLSIRDKKDQYLENIPLVEKYLISATERYRDFHPLRNFLNKVIK